MLRLLRFPGLLVNLICFTIYVSTLHLFRLMCELIIFLLKGKDTYKLIKEDIDRDRVPYTLIDCYICEIRKWWKGKPMWVGL